MSQFQLFDGRGLKCPMLFVQFKLAFKKVQASQALQGMIVLADDLQGSQDIQRFLQERAWNIQKPNCLSWEALPESMQTELFDIKDSLFTHWPASLLLATTKDKHSLF